MIDIKTLVDIMEWQDKNPDNPFFFDENTDSVIEALGDDCGAVMELFKTADKEMLLFLSQFTESITEKFNYDEELISTLEEVYHC